MLAKSMARQKVTGATLPDKRATVKKGDLVETLPARSNSWRKKGEGFCVDWPQRSGCQKQILILERILRPLLADVSGLPTKFQRNDSAWTRLGSRSLSGTG